MGLKLSCCTGLFLEIDFRCGTGHAHDSLMSVTDI